MPLSLLTRTTATSVLARSYVSSDDDVVAIDCPLHSARGGQRVPGRVEVGTVGIRHRNERGGRLGEQHHHERGHERHTGADHDDGSGESNT